MEKKTIIVDAKDYEGMHECFVRMNILKDYIESDKYIDKDTVMLIMGMERKENDNG